MKKKAFIVFGSPSIGQREINEVVAVLKSGWLSTGPRVHRFEELFRQYKGSRYAIALNSCTAALHLSLKVMGIKPGDEVLVPAMTFCATANAVIHAGGKPVLIDCERETQNIDPKEIVKRITRRTRAIVPVHFAGRPCNMNVILAIAKEHNLKIIEDCAHAVEAEIGGRKVGTFGDIGCFSFYVTKNLTTGEGGMVVTNNEEYAKQIKILSLHGMSKDAWARFSAEGYTDYQVIDAGFKYNMMDIQAAIGIHQLSQIEKGWQVRKKIWKKYDDAFRNYPVFIPAPVGGTIKHAYHLYTLMLDIDKLRISRDRFVIEMKKRKVGVGIHYRALHLHPYYQKTFGYKEGDFPNAEWVSERTVSLPLSPKLSDKEIEEVIRAVKEVIT